MLTSTSPEGDAEYPSFEIVATMPETVSRVCAAYGCNLRLTGRGYWVGHLHAKSMGVEGKQLVLDPLLVIRYLYVYLQ